FFILVVALSPVGRCRTVSRRGAGGRGAGPRGGTRRSLVDRMADRDGRRPLVAGSCCPGMGDAGHGPQSNGNDAATSGGVQEPGVGSGRTPALPTGGFVR